VRCKHCNKLLVDRKKTPEEMRNDKKAVHEEEPDEKDLAEFAEFKKFQAWQKMQEQSSGSQSSKKKS